MLNLEKFSVTGLYVNKNIQLRFKNNNLIIVGENGSGKTTILRLFYYFISMQWEQLLVYQFETITIKFESQQELSVSQKDILRFSHLRERFERQLPPSLYKALNSLLENGTSINDALAIIERNYRYPIRRLVSSIDFEDMISQEHSRKQKTISEYLQNGFKDVLVLYLPTYRRIEQDLKKLHRRLGRDDDDDWEPRKLVNNISNSSVKFYESIEFGMDDVSQNLDSILKKLQQDALETLNGLTLNYLSDVVNKTYTNFDAALISNTSNDMIDKILQRVDPSILSVKSKESLKMTLDKVKNTKKGNNGFDPSDQVICHYFIKLLDFYNRFEEKEKNIRDFFSVCNLYLEDKKFEYDSVSHLYSLVSKDDIQQKIELNQLSSGEKQIVAMFSYMYLSEKEHYFIIIDEPELSLSVKWQQRFLDDVHKGQFCSGLLAVTHSPFIYDNDLLPYTHGINEFIVSKQ